MSRPSKNKKGSKGKDVPPTAQPSPRKQFVPRSSPFQGTLTATESQTKTKTPSSPPKPIKKTKTTTTATNIKMKQSITKRVNTDPCPQRKPVRPQEMKIIHRFYEPLVLLFTLDRTRGDRLSEPTLTDMASLSIEEARRTFLKALADACDYDKGGDTVTSIGLEQIPEANVFWVASNKSPADKIAPFLERLLGQLTGGWTDETILEGDIRQTCIEFATPRIKTYRRLIERVMEVVRCKLTSSYEGTHYFRQR
jgi:hypothetical protein